MIAPGTKVTIRDAGLGHIDPWYFGREGVVRDCAHFYSPQSVVVRIDRGDREIDVLFHPSELEVIA